MGRLLNQVLRYELSRVAHRRKTYVYRVALLLVMLFAAFVCAAEVEMSLRYRANPTAAIAAMGSGLFHTAVVLAWLVIVFAAPTLAAGLIAEEKERQTLPLLVVTDLSDLEIISAKVLTCLAVIGSTVLGFLPIVFLCLIFGGVSWHQIIGHFGLLIGVLCFGCGTGIYYSARCPNVGLAARRARGITLLAVLGPFILLALASLVDAAMEWGFRFGEAMLVALSLVNPILSAIFLSAPLAGGPLGMGTALRFAWIPSTLIWLLGFTFFCRLAARKLADRESLLLTTEEEVKLFRRKAHGPVDRPTRSVWGNPVAWRAWHATRGLRPVVFVVCCLLFFVVIPIMAEVIEVGSGPWLLGSSLYHWITIMIETLVAAAFLAERGGGSLTPEIEKRTLPLLAVTDLTPHEIVGGKAMGILRRGWGLLVLPMGHAIVAALFGVVGWVTPLFLFLDMVVFCGFLFACSLWISLRSRRSSRAIAWSQFVLLMIVILIPLPVGMLFSWCDEGGTMLLLWPGMWTATSVHPLDMSFGEIKAPCITRMEAQGGYLGYAGCLVLYAVLAGVLYWRTVRRFEVIAQRE